MVLAASLSEKALLLKLIFKLLISLAFVCAAAVPVSVSVSCKLLLLTIEAIRPAGKLFTDILPAVTKLSPLFPANVAPL